MAVNINIPSQVTQNITEGVTSTAPSEDAVFNALADKANTTDLAEVATSGDYNDLINQPTIPTSLPPSGNAGGDLTGTYPNPTVSQIHGHEMQSGTPSANDVWVYGGSPAKWQHQHINASQVDNDSSVTGTNTKLALEHLDSTKQPNLVSGTTIKTVNSNSLLGSGNVAVQDTLVSGTNIKTINGTSLLGSGNITVGGGITIGTTAITSGTVGRILFQGTGDVTQQDSSLFWDNTNKRLGIGATPSTSVRLDVRAQGALSTDIAFRVRNSADTGNISEFRGNGVGIVCGISTARAVFSPYNAHGGDGFIMTTQDLAPNASPTKAAMFMTETYTNFYGSGGTQSISFAVDTTYGGTTRQWQFSNLNLNDGALYIGTGNSATNNRRMFLTDSAVLNIGKDTMGNTQSGTNQLRILNGTAPTSLATDTFALYSADITAGNAAPHFRTENGNIIKLYRQSSAGITTVSDLVTVLTNLGLLA